MNIFKSLSKHVEKGAENTKGLVRNNAGGLSRKTTDWDQMMRFLVLGTTGGTYYVGEDALTELNVDCLQRCFDADPERAVETICAVTREGRAASKDPAIFALAVGISRMEETAGGKQPSKASQLALARAFEVAKTFTDFSHLLSFLRKMRGFGKGLQRGLSRFYTERPVGSLEYQLVKYWQRDGFSQQDAFRLTHPASFMAAPEPARRLLWDYAAKGVVPNRDLLLAHGLTKLAAYGELQDAGMTPVRAVEILRANSLPMEAVPTHLRTAELYEAVLFGEGNGMTWLLRNLSNLAEKELLTLARHDVVDHVCKILADEDEIKRQRMHPLTLLKALLAYKSGRKVRKIKKKTTWGSEYEEEVVVATWEPVRRVIDAADAGFKKSFRYAPASGKRLLLAVDISSSMWGARLSALQQLSTHEAAAIMALVVANVEPAWTLVVFDNTGSTKQVDLSPTMTVDQVIKHMRISQRGTSTDLTDPVKWARGRKIAFDGVVTFTDGETWRNEYSLEQELEWYAQTVGHRAKVVNVAMTANNVTNGGGENRDLLECVGFDTDVPQAISLFMTN